MKDFDYCGGCYNRGLFVEKIKLKGSLPGGSYLKKIPAVKHLERERELSFESRVTFFVGENGSGKSTLVEAIAVACGFNPEGGTKNYSFSTSATHSELWKSLTVSRLRRERDGYFLRSESFYNSATYLDELDSIACPAPKILSSYGGKSLHEQSHGESFISLVEKRFGRDGLYILDEPEAALSPMQLMRLICRMKELENAGCQFIISTHSPILMSYPGALIMELSDEGIKTVDWRQTQHYAVTKKFLDDPEGMYMLLFGE